jgi:hypothetical protein
MLCDVDTISIELIGQRPFDTVEFPHSAGFPSLKEVKCELSKKKKIKQAMSNTSALKSQRPFFAEANPRRSL